MIDFYDNDLPEVRLTWAESLAQGKDAIILTAKVVAIPLSAFAVTCVFNYWVNKKIGSL